jgi:xanthine/uracil/vitamin C permease (AzgA family)
MYTVQDTSQVCSLNPTTGRPEATGLGARSANYQCVKYKMRSGTMWLGIWAGVLIVVLTYYEVKAAIMYGVLFATLVSWIPGSAVSYLTDATPGGAQRFEYFRKVRGCSRLANQQLGAYALFGMLYRGTVMKCYF